MTLLAEAKSSRAAETLFWILRGLALGQGLRIFSIFRVVSRVNPTCWVSLTHDFSFPLPVVVIDGLYELMEIPQGNGPIVVHHFVFDTTS